MIKKIAAALLGACTVLAFSACGRSADGEPAQSATANQKVKISVTFNAMAEFAKVIGKDKADVSTIIPNGTEPHDFEPKAKDLAGLSSARIFVYNGLGMESWAEKAVPASGNKNLITVEASKGTEPIRSADDGESGEYDPHIWLSPKSAEIEVKNICGALVQADPANAEYYRKNCDSYVAQLESLSTEYGAKFKAAKNKSFVTGHAAFAYLCRDFGLQQNSVEDVFAEGEPSARRLTELIDYCRANHVKTVFYEDMLSPEISKMLAREAGANLRKIYSMESAEDDKSYLERMKENLQAINDSLQES